VAHRIWLWLLPLMLATGLEAQVADLDAFVAAKAGALEVLHRKAERVLVAVAQDSSYRENFKARSDHHRQEKKSGSTGSRSRPRASSTSAKCA
jgi:hypothetical protein